MQTIAESGPITVTLPEGVADIIRKQVSSGEYLNAADAIEAAMVATLLPYSPPDTLNNWIATEGTRRCALMDADPSRGLTFEQIRENLGLEDDEEAFLRAG